MIDGAIDYVNDEFVYKNLAIEGDYPDLSVWLQRFGLPPLATSAGGGGIRSSSTGRSRTRRSTRSTTLAGVPCLDKVRDRRLDVPRRHPRRAGSRRRASAARCAAPRGSTCRRRRARDPEARRRRPEPRGGASCAGSRASRRARSTRVADRDRAHADRQDAHARSTGCRSSRRTSARRSSPSARRRTRTSSMCVNHASDDKLCRPWAGRLDYRRPRRLRGCQEARRVLHRRGRHARRRRQARGDDRRRAATDRGAPLVRRAPRRHDRDRRRADGRARSGQARAAACSRRRSTSSGKPSAPQADGQIDLLRSWAYGAFIGDVHPAIAPVVDRQAARHPDHRRRAGRPARHLRRRSAPTAPYPVDIALSGRRVELDQFIDLSKKLGARRAGAGVGIGHRDRCTPSSATRRRSPRRGSRSPSSTSILNHRSRDGRLTPLRFSLVSPAQGRYAMSLHVTNDTVELACRNAAAPNGREPCPAQLDTPAGRVSIEGQASAAGMALSAHGTLALARLAPLLEGQVDSLDGSLQLTGRDRRHVREADLRGRARRRQGDRAAPARRRLGAAVAPGGQIKLANGAIGFNGISFNVKDERRDERGALHVAGTIGLDGFTPARWGVLVDGEITGKMLQAIAPNAVSQASGLASIDGALSLSGTGPLPLVRGTISFAPVPDVTDKNEPQTSPIAFIPRGVRRELSFSRGERRHRHQRRRQPPHVHDQRRRRAADRVDRRRGPARERACRCAAARRHAGVRARLARRRCDPVPHPGRARSEPRRRRTSTSCSRRIRTRGRRRGNVAIVSGEYTRNFDLTEALKPAAAEGRAGEAVLGRVPVDRQRRPRPDARGAPVRREEQHRARRRHRARGPAHPDHGIAARSAPRRHDPRPARRVQAPRHARELHTRRPARSTSPRTSRASNPTLSITSEATDYLDLSGQQHTHHAHDHRLAREASVGPPHEHRPRQVADDRADLPRPKPRAAAALARRSVARLGADDPADLDEPVDRASPIRSSRTSPATGSRACSATR